ncbi:MAG: FIG137776: Glycosyltransferase [uncultured Sphingosinicella sp.]|uniref:FIG137776: Glycosyltransferase n=1 Tax=uncultured Sphingosinicella sp. TaxID=478748 RepID=A0A6J4UGU2_9SPHN|nr:TIGR03087 family PEP-CTERM/XrtA system glycosyltransferase [uncultured Sphingosinicella sp.]CAA9548261.1 MAG: FIG137776: Glycosyltransferase [uncultured Sphingosinicella sp.]
MSDILFLAHRIPFPPDRGDKIRSWNILKHLGSLARVHVACFADDQADAAHLAAMKRELGSALGEAHVEIRNVGKFAAAARAFPAGQPISLAMFDSLRMRAFVDDLLERRSIDTVFAFSGQMAQFVPDPCPARFLMDFVDMDSAKFADYAGEGGGAMRWVHRWEAERLFAFERATAARADASIFVSEAEASLFRRKAGLAKADIRAIGNGIDLDFYDPAAAFPRLTAEERGQGPLIVFTGQMDYRPNLEAVTAFACDVLPLIRQSRPDTRFAIVGRKPLRAVTRLAAEPGVIVTGSVPDVRSWLAAADVVVAPLAIGRGVQNKVLEAMAMARPVIASPAAFLGIEAEPDRDLIVAEGAQAQAREALGLIANHTRAAEIGLSARRRMEVSYRWKAQLEPLTQLLGLTQRQAA